MVLCIIYFSSYFLSAHIRAEVLGVGQGRPLPHLGVQKAMQRVGEVVGLGGHGLQGGGALQQVGQLESGLDAQPHRLLFLQIEKNVIEKTTEL